MARSADEISKQIRSQLKILDPDISAEPLTPERKIIDTVAEVIAEAESDKYILDYQFDIDSKIGSDLDKFVALFGFSRQGGKRAKGTVTFSVDSPATSDIYIPVGTVVMTQSSSIASQVEFSTTSSVVLFTGLSSVNAPIQAKIVGTTSNVPAGTIVTVGSSNLGQISEVTNPTATSGGTELESDDELRIRFKNTIFRNIAGTKQQFLALALSSSLVTKARIISPIDRFIEYIQIGSDLTATSVIPYSKHTFNFDYFLSQTNAAGSEIFYNPTVDYSISTAVPPVITILNEDSANNFTVDSVLLLEHSYTSTNSRNDPTNSIMNYIDIYVSGDDPQAGLETAIYPVPSGSVAPIFSTNSSNTYYTGNFRRFKTRLAPTANNIFQKLLFQPVTALPETIVINGNTFYQDSDFWLVEDTTVNRGSVRSINGIEWGSRAFSTVPSGTAFSINYTFNKLPISLNELMNNHKQVGTDVLVHAGNKRYFNVGLIVSYTAGFTKTAVNSSINIALSNFFENFQFGGIIQISDITDAVHQVAGVDNVRLAKAGDGVTYGVQEVAPDGSTLIGLPYTTDFFLQDTDLPIFNSSTITQKSQNTWTT